MSDIDVTKRLNVLQIVSGDSEDIPGIYLNPENDLPVDASSFTDIIFTIRDKKNKKILEKKLSNSSIEWETDGADGEFVIHFNEKDTHNLKGIFKYDLQFMDSSSKPRTPVRSFILIKEDITK